MQMNLLWIPWIWMSIWRIFNILKYICHKSTARIYLVKSARQQKPQTDEYWRQKSSCLVRILVPEAPEPSRLGTRIVICTQLVISMDQGVWNYTALYVATPGYYYTNLDTANSGRKRPYNFAVQKEQRKQILFSPTHTPLPLSGL